MKSSEFLRAAVRPTLGVALVTATAVGAHAASHREAPQITEMPKVDSTDFYAFRSYESGRGDYVTFIANYQPIQIPYAGPNYYTMDPDAVYEIHVDYDGDAIEDLTFQFDFENRLAAGGSGIALPVNGTDVAIPLRYAGQVTSPPDAQLNEIESYSLKLITGDRRGGTIADVVRAGSSDTTFLKPLDNVGTKTIPAYSAYADQFIYSIDIPGCATPGRVFVGQRVEGFAVNLGPVFDLINIVPIDGDDPRGSGNGMGFSGGITQDRAANEQVLGRVNVTSLALEVPVACLTGSGNATIGTWTSASLPQGRLLDPSPTYAMPSSHGGAYVQVSRLGAPLVNEVVIGLPDKDLFSAAEPTQDSALATYVTNPTLPELIEILFGGQAGLPATLAPNNFPRNDLVTAFLTGFPGLNQQSIVTGSEMLRLNTAVPPTPSGSQSPFGVVGEDLAGFPNGRRPGDDVVDIALRVVMGRLCHPIPLGAELGVSGAVENQPSDNIDLGLCAPSDAPVGTAAFTDGAPVSDADFDAAFPYLRAPLPGAN